MAEVPLTDRYTPNVLLNEGIAVPVLVPGETETVEGEVVPKKAIRYLRFSARHVAKAEDLYDGLRGQVEITETNPVLDSKGEPLMDSKSGEAFTTTKVIGREERIFYGQEALQYAMGAYPTKVTFQLMGLAWSLDEEALDGLLIAGEMPTYSLAVSHAWALAQGADPMSAARGMKKALESLAARREDLAKQLDEGTLGALGEPTTSSSDESTDSDGLNGPVDGSLPDEA